MKRKTVWLGLLLFAALCILEPIDAPTAAAQGDPNQTILNLVNDLRARNGLPPFVWDQRLASAAQNQAGFMAANNIYSHSGSGGSTPQSRASGAGFPGRATENVVGGTNLTPGQGVVWWINSPIHLNTLLSPQYSHVGIGNAYGFEQNFYALVAGSPSDVVAQAVPQVTDDNDQLLAPVAPIVLAEPREDGSIVHTVGSGQSFWVIAARYEVPLNQLYLFNNLNEGSVISPGDELIIRLADGQEPPPTPTPPPFHTVRDGDSWWTIAAWHDLSVGDILWLNSASERTVLRAGDQVRIALLAGEEPPPTATPQIKHVVSAGETVWDLSLRYGISVRELIEANGLAEEAMISVGQELFTVTLTPIPTATTEPTPTLVPTATATAAPTNTAVPSPPPASENKLAKRATETPAPESTHFLAPPALGQTGLVVGAALLAVGFFAIIFVWRRLQ